MRSPSGGAGSGRALAVFRCSGRCAPRAGRRGPAPRLGVVRVRLAAGAGCGAGAGGRGRPRAAPRSRRSRRRRRCPGARLRRPRCAGRGGRGALRAAGGRARRPAAGRAAERRRSLRAWSRAARCGRRAASAVLSSGAQLDALPLDRDQLGAYARQLRRGLGSAPSSSCGAPRRGAASPARPRPPRREPSASRAQPRPPRRGPLSVAAPPRASERAAPELRRGRLGALAQGRGLGRRRLRAGPLRGELGLRRVRPLARRGGLGLGLGGSRDGVVGLRARCGQDGEQTLGLLAAGDLGPRLAARRGIGAAGGVPPPRAL